MLIKRGKKQDLERFAADIISKEIETYLISHETIILGLIGGKSVEGLYQLLTKKNLDWKSVHVFLLDERCIPLDSKESNSQVIKKYFSRKLQKKNIHLLNYKKNSLYDYTSTLRKYGNNFDIIILSSGEDGHVASLFPNHPSLKSRKVGYIKISDSPKPPSERISATRKLLEKSSLSFLLFFGKEKKQAFRKFLDNNVSIEQCPTKLVKNIKKSFVLVNV